MDEKLISVNEAIDLVGFKMRLAIECTERKDYESAIVELKDVLTLESKSIEANYLLGQIYEFKEDFKKAASCYRIVLEFDPIDEFKLRAANTFEMADMDEDAMALYKELYAKDPDNRDIIDKLAHLSILMGKIEDAIEYYHILFEKDPDDEVATGQLMELYENTDKFMHYKFKGLIAKRDKRLSHAIGSYKNALNLNHEDTELRYELAELYLETEEKEKAIEEFLKILDTNSTNLLVLKKLAETYIALDNHELALNVFEQIIEINPGDVVALNNLAEIYIEIEDNERAIELLTKAISINTKNIQSRILLSKAYLAIKDPIMAYTNIQKAKIIEPENVEVLTLLSDYYILEGKYQKALEIAESIKTLIPKSPFCYRKMAEIHEHNGDVYNTHYNYGIYHKLKGEKTLAIDEFAWAHDINPNNQELILELAKLYEEIDEDYIACDYYEKLYKLDNLNFSSLKKMSEIFIKKGDYIRAQDILEEILETNENDFDARLGLGQIAEKQKNLEVALSNYKFYIDNAPLSPKFPELREKINVIQERINDQNDEGIFGKLLKIFSR